ncbi:type II CAAX prenyl endopeptidase Rce1 family protein [Halorubrum rutilum]|uniref:Type II CAAX prenyl endopeptidase Rce1 family protein n=1 Tax=Halorubrum rutilum TaxID=1364933 RepID=A0ABD6AFY0_9EURY|nr:CPBP family glutamic-type intramembrane protease [Halorubrum rutilum]
MADPSSDDGNRREPGASGGEPSAPDGGEPADGSTAPGDGPATADDAVASTAPEGPGGRAVAVAIGTALLLGVLGPAIALASGGVVLGINTVTGGLPLAASLALTLVLGQYVAFGGLALGYLAWRGLDRAGIVAYLGVRRPSLKEIGLVIGSWALILVAITAVSAVIQQLGTETASNQSAELAMQNPAIIPLLVAASFLVIGPSEEILYRGVVQGRLRETLSPAPAILIASAIFAAVHVMALTGGISGRLTTIAILFFPSIVFGAVYEYTGNLVVPALLHGLHNAVIFTILYITIAYSDELRAAAGGSAALLPV